MRKIKLTSNVYLRNIMTLLTGTSIAQIIPIAITPVLTRIYSPHDFGVFALYTSIVAILSVIATGRYELAIIIPKKDTDAVNVGVLAIVIALIFTSLLTLMLLLFGEVIQEFLNISKLGFWIYFIPVSIILLAVYQVVYYILNRQKMFKVMSVNKVIQQVSIGASNVSIGLLNRKLGLIAGTIVGQLISLILIIKKLFNTNKTNFTQITRSGLREQGKKYINFPKYLTFAHVLNVSSSNLSVILFNKFFTATAVGHFSVTQRILRMPLAIVGSAISDVFRQKAAEDLQTKGTCKKLYIRTFLVLVSLGAVPFTLLFLISPSLFAIVFGAEWRAAGEYARYLIPMLFMQFITSPFSSLFMILEKQKMDLLWQICLFILSVTGILVGYFVFNSIDKAIIFYSCAYCIMYFINGLLTFNFASKRK